MKLFHSFNRRIVLLVLALFVVFTIAPVFAQEATHEPTPIVVTSPPTFINADTGISISTLVYGIIIAILGGGGAAAFVLRFGSSKQNIDALEKLYQSASPETQEIIRERFVELEGIVKRLLDIADKATDNLPNAEITVAGSGFIDPTLSSHA